MKQYLTIFGLSGLLILLSTGASAKVELIKGLRSSVESVYFIPKRGSDNKTQIATIKLLNQCENCIKQLSVNADTFIISEKGAFTDIGYLQENNSYFAVVIGFDKSTGIATRIKLTKASTGAQ